MSAVVEVESIYSAYCEDCDWADGVITTTKEQAERMVDRHNAERHPEDMGRGRHIIIDENDRVDWCDCGIGQPHPGRVAP